MLYVFLVFFYCDIGDVFGLARNLGDLGYVGMLEWYNLVGLVGLGCFFAFLFIIFIFRSALVWFRGVGE